MKENYSKLKKEYDKLLRNIEEKEDDCARQNKSFEEMIELTEDERLRLFDISKEMRLIQDPVIQFGKTYYNQKA